MAIKRDRVNRVKGLVYLPMDVSRLHRGQEFTLTHVEERDIDYSPENPLVKDPMLMKEPVNGDAVGDAVFDAMGGAAYVADVIGYSGVGGTDVAVFSHMENGYAVLIDTGYTNYVALTPKEDIHVCDAGLSEV